MSSGQWQGLVHHQLRDLGQGASSARVEPASPIWRCSGGLPARGVVGWPRLVLYKRCLARPLIDVPASSKTSVSTSHLVSFTFVQTRHISRCVQACYHPWCWGAGLLPSPWPPWSFTMNPLHQISLSESQPHKSTLDAKLARVLLSTAHPLAHRFISFLARQLGFESTTTCPTRISPW